MTLLPLLLGLPVLAGVALVLVGPRADRVAPAVGALTAAAALGLSLGAGTGASAGVPFLLGLGLDLRLDGLSQALAVTVCAVTTVVLACVPTQVTERRGRLCGWLLLFLASVLLTLVADSLLPLLIGWELMGAASYLLIAHAPRDTRAVGSASTALLTTRAMDLGLYLAAGAALAGGGTLSLSGLAELPAGWRSVAALGVTTAALGKAAQLPVSFWLARAMDGPSPVSALLHSAAMVAMGGYLLVRLSPLLAATGWAAGVVLWIGAATALLLGAVALVQADLKLLLAASTASQLGFVVMAAGLGATGPGAAQLVAHASVKSLLFLAAGIWLHLLGTKQLSGLHGAARRMPAVGALATVGLLSLAGLPPFALWGSKDLVLDAAREHGLAVYLVALAAAALSAGYAGRALSVLLRTPQRLARPDTLEPDPQEQRAEPAAWVPLLLPAAGALLLLALSLGPGREAFGRLVGDVPPASPLTALLLSAGLGLAALLAVVRWGDLLAARAPDALHDWLSLERAAHAVAVRPVLALSRALATFDDRILDRGVEAIVGRAGRLAGVLARSDDAVLDGAVHAVSRATLAGARRSGHFDVSGIDAAVSAVSEAVVRGGRSARRLQTGQLHQYYGQAAALFAVSTLLLLLLR